MLENFKARAEEIKKTRMAAELIVYEEKVENFLNFNVTEELIKNQERARKDLKRDRILGSIGTTVYLGIVASLALSGGALALPFAAMAVYGGGMLGGFEVTALTIGSFSTNAQAENKQHVESMLKRLEKDVEYHTVKDKTTISDYFQASKVALKDLYNKAKEIKLVDDTSIHDVYQVSREKMLAQRDIMRAKINELKNPSGKLKM